MATFALPSYWVETLIVDISVLENLESDGDALPVESWIQHGACGIALSRLEKDQGWLFRVDDFLFEVTSCDFEHLGRGEIAV